MKAAKVMVPFKGLPDGAAHVRHFEPGDVVEGDLAAVAIREKWAVDAAGPTIEEWVQVGYKASAYPPSGYPSRSSQSDIDAAIAAQDAGGLNDLTVAELKLRAADLKIDLGDATKKADIIAAIELATEA